MLPEQLARKLHDTFGKLAPEYKVTIVSDYKAFNPNTKEGQLLMAVCREVIEWGWNMEKPF